jgi:hypothetical protein
MKTRRSPLSPFTPSPLAYRQALNLAGAGQALGRGSEGNLIIALAEIDGVR